MYVNLGSRFIILFVSILLGACGQLLLKFGVNNMGGVNLAWKNLIPALWGILSNGWIILGIMCFASSMVLWLKVISNMELSRAYPSVSLSYVIVFFLSIALFNEGITLPKIGGMISILVGVFLMQQ